MKLLSRIIEVGIPLLGVTIIGYILWVVIAVLSNTPNF